MTNKDFNQSIKKALTESKTNKQLVNNLIAIHSWFHLTNEQLNIIRRIDDACALDVPMQYEDFMLAEEN